MNYNKIVNTITSDIFLKWKKDFLNKKKKSVYKNIINFNNIIININAKIEYNTSDTLFIDGNYFEKNDCDNIDINFNIGKDLLPYFWSEISFNLKDVLRHEIEHVTQNNEIIFPTKFMENDSYIRDMINIGLLSKANYFKLPKEIDANLQGLYYRAKKEKKCFLEIINNYLSFYDITKQEKEEIIYLWNKRAKQLNLPKII